MFATVVEDENENHSVVEIVVNQIDDIVDDDDEIVGVNVGDDVDVDVDVDVERMVVVWEMDDDFVHFVLVEYSYRLIVSLSDR